MKVLYISLVLSISNVVYSKYPFQNTSLSWNTRVNDLVGRLTVKEITMQMAKGGGGIGGPAPAVSRLGIKRFQWNTECLRGVALSGKATAFPQSINLGAMFSWRMMKKVATAIGSEVRAKANNYTSHGSYNDHQGLNCWAPMINTMRHPLWGRNQEVYGEDPFLTGSLATAYIHGLQGDRKRYIQAAASCKAFVAYAGPEDKPVSRLTFNAQVSDRDLHLTYLPAFRQCVVAGAYSMMCSYNSVNGIPMCANKRIMKDILRDQWGFKGFVVSDMGAIEAIVETHKYLNSSLETIKATLESGCGLELSTNIHRPYYTQIADAIHRGLINESMIRQMLKPLFYTRMRLGEFDPSSRNPYAFYNLSLVQSEGHQDLAIKSAMKSFVLLKNDKFSSYSSEKLLPLKRKYKTMAVLGPMADNLDQLYGDYNADIDPNYASTPFEALRTLADKVKYASGCYNNTCTSYNQSEIVDAVKDVELIIICLGTGVEIECEGRDRTDMNLPGKQAQIVKDALKYNNEAPVLLLIFSAGPVNISFVDIEPRVPAIMQCFFPAQATGKALFNVVTLSTKDSSPAGRLPYTWYNTVAQIPSMVNYSMNDRTYRYFNGVPAYPFGYGLSYTTFRYANLTYDKVLYPYQDYMHVGVDVFNEGYIGSDEVAQLYISWLTTEEKMPKYQLVAFDRLYIEPLRQVTFKFLIEMNQFAVWTDTRGFAIEKGEIGLFVGGQLPGQIRKVPSNVLYGTILVMESWTVR